MRTRIKICGITRLEDARLAADLGADALGFNFYRQSPRYIAPCDARSIIAQLPPLIMVIGVFADEADSEEVLAVVREAGVRGIQLHGPRFPKLNGPLAELPLIRAVAVGGDFKTETLKDLRADAILLDSYHPELKGGTGRSIDWNLARKAAEYGTIILAGGLNPENVRRAITEVRPFAVDVATGVESAPGQKNAARLSAFFAAVKEADGSF